MQPKRIAQPDFNFKVETIKGIDIVGKNYFASEVSIIKCIDGEATVSINFRTHKFVKEANFILIESLLFKILECSENFTMKICRFSTQFFNEIYPVLDKKVNDALLYNAPDLFSLEEMKITDVIFNQLCQLYDVPEHSYRNKIAVNLAINYALETYDFSYKLMDNQTIDTTERMSKLADRFWFLCVKEHHIHRDSKFYAQKLNISERHLYKISTEAFLMTPKQNIDYITSGTIKKLLLTTSLSNQQIADQMNFPDQATFGQFFKRNVGMSPSEFRKKYK